jgi:adenylate cyclase
MPQEIEHKYLVRLEDWKPTTAGVLYQQGYLSSVKERVVRVRIAEEQAYLTIKSLMRGVTRLEFEYAIPVSDAATMLDLLCEPPLIKKTRYREAFGGRTWDIDVFHGDNEGLVVAEVEVTSESEPLQKLACRTVTPGGVGGVGRLFAGTGTPTRAVAKSSKPRFVLSFVVVGSVDLFQFLAWLVLFNPRHSLPDQGSW